MPRLATVARRLVAAPKPVLCLDTCDLLEVVQCLDWEKPGVPRSVTCVEAAFRLDATLAVNPDRVAVVVTDLVEREWTQNIAGVVAKARAFLARLDESVGRPYLAAQIIGTALPPFPPLSAGRLVDDLENLSRGLLNRVVRLSLARPLIERAWLRVCNKTRPSHEGHIKDSVNLEHYLELARLLRVAGFVEDVVFVSKNRRDFWAGDTPHLHPDLLAEFTDPAVRMAFHGSLAAAMGALRI